MQAESCRGGPTRVAALIFVLLWPIPAAAQLGSAIGGGAGVAFYRAMDDLAHDSAGFALIYRLGRPDGFRPTFGFNWYSAGFDTIIEGRRVELGEVRVRPIMAGYGYWMQHGRVTAGATLIAGVAFNGFDTADPARIAYLRSLDQLLLRIDASHGLAARAEFGVWYDLTAKLGLLGSVGYVAARPRITIVTETTSTESRLRADAIKLQVGLVYAPF